MPIPDKDFNSAYDIAYRANEKAYKRLAITNACESCGKYGKLEGHHVLVGRDKRYKTWCNSPLNISWVCKECHDGVALSESYRETHMRRLVLQQGYAVVRDWLDSAPEGKKRGSQWARASFLLEWVVS